MEPICKNLVIDLLKTKNSLMEKQAMLSKSNILVCGVFSIGLLEYYVAIEVYVKSVN